MLKEKRREGKKVSAKKLVLFRKFCIYAPISKLQIHISKKRLFPFFISKEINKIAVTVIDREQ